MKKSKKMAVAITLAAILFGLVIYQYGYLKVVAEVAGIREGQSMKAKTLEKYITLISEKPQIEKDLALLKDMRKAEESKLIEGQTLSIATAALQDSIKGIITGKGGTISSEMAGKPADYGKFKIISVTMDTVLPDSRALGDILYYIETHVPYLVVKDVDVRIMNYASPRELAVRFEITAMTAISAGKV